MKNKKTNILLISIIVIFVIVLLIYLLFFNNKDNIKDNFSFDIITNYAEVEINSIFEIQYELKGEYTITWSSSDTEVATVDKGFVVTKNMGKAIITGSVTNNGKEIKKSCVIDVYKGNKGVPIQDVLIPEGELFITKGDISNLEYEYVPIDSYVKSVEYSSEDETIAFFDGKINSSNIGTTKIKIVINKNIIKEITVNVIEQPITPTFSKKIEKVIPSEENITLNVNEEKELSYEIEPTDAFIYDKTWFSSNENIIEVDDGKIKAKAAGEAKTCLRINDTITEINITVLAPVSSIQLNSSDKIILKRSDSVKINTTVLPENASNKKIKYTSSNANSLRVDESGTAYALGEGSGTITIETENSQKTATVSFIVHPQTGLIKGNGGIWGYTNSQTKAPVRADLSFFDSLAKKGIGVLNGNMYTYADSKNIYRYDISTSTLKTNTRTILMRIYYPEGADLSSVNTFTFMGGKGDRKMGSYFTKLDNNREYLKTSGIVILVSTLTDSAEYNKDDAIQSTEFVKSIVKQKAGVKNTVGGYSMSGPKAAQAANDANYDRLLIFDSYVSNVSDKTNLKNKKIVFYSPTDDHYANTGETQKCLREMKNVGYTDVTIITNNNEIIDEFKNKFLIINPGSNLGSGHGADNITKSNFFAYANE